MITSNYAAFFNKTILIKTRKSIRKESFRISRLTNAVLLFLMILLSNSNVFSQTVFSRHLSPISGSEYDTATTSGCASCQILNPDNAADTSLTNYTSVNVQGGSGDKAAIRLLLETMVAGGGNAGVVFDRGGSSNPAVLSSISVSTYKAGVLQESKSGSALTSYIVSGGGGLRAVEFTTTKDFDAVELEVRRLGGGVNSMEVYYAYGNNAAPLPIELMNFVAVQEKNFVRLNWQTASEYNNSHFVLQRSDDGVVFKDIEIIKGNVNTTNIKHYSTVDFSPKEGLNYYRLKQVDINNTENYHKAVLVNFNPALKVVKRVNIYPNPAVYSVNIQFEDEGSKVIKVKDIMGITYISESIYSKNRQLDVSALSKGTYIVYVYGENNELIHKQFITKF